MQPKPLHSKVQGGKGKDEANDENIVKIPIESLDTFISEPAAAVMEKLFAQRRTAISLTDLRTLSDTGDIVKVSYSSSILDNSMEIVKSLKSTDSDADDIVLKTVEMDFGGDILTCKYEDVTWVRDSQVRVMGV